MPYIKEYLNSGGTFIDLVKTDYKKCKEALINRFLCPEFPNRAIRNPRYIGFLLILKRPSEINISGSSNVSIFVPFFSNTSEPLKYHQINREFQKLCDRKQPPKSNHDYYADKKQCWGKIFFILLISLESNAQLCANFPQVLDLFNFATSLHNLTRRIEPNSLNTCCDSWLNIIVV